MELINANELISAGYTFTIEDEATERSFDDSGELSGCSFELPLDYIAYDSDGETEALVDTNDLSDDHGRWHHVADTHLRERELQRALYSYLDIERRPWREKSIVAEWRYQRFMRLAYFISDCDNTSKLRRLKTELWRRYKQSCKACAVSSTWWALYLTKYQVTYLMTIINLKLY